MYDVFISFRREDTRTNFTSHVYAALSRKHIKAFIDSKNLRTRNEILSNRSLLKPIETSQLCLVIFSPNYGSSRRCLTELENILTCSRQHGKKVLPVFYKVHPSEVRNQTGRFGINFAGRHEGHEEPEKVLKWRAALMEAADLPGLHLNDHTPEREFIDEIVSAILRELKPHDTIVTLEFEHGYQLDFSSGLRLSGTKSGAKEWAWVVMSFLFEGLSATSDQLGYTLTCMVMAYVALLLFVVEITLKARKKMLTWTVDRTSWLPRFGKRSAPAHKMFLVSVVEQFGLASAIWQCFYSTLQYMYKSHNPLKICLLPSLFVSCVIVSKCIRERGKKGQE